MKAMGGNSKRKGNSSGDEEEVDIQDVDFKIVGVNYSEMNGPITTPGPTEMYNGSDSQNLSNSERSKAFGFDVSHKGLIGNGIDESIKQ